MATDPQTLYSQSACFACFVQAGTAQILEIALLAQWAKNATNIGSNVIPGGSIYNAGTSQFTQALTPGFTYNLVMRTNDGTANDGIQGILKTQTPIQFAAITVGGLCQVILSGTPGAAVTATITLGPANTIPDQTHYSAGGVFSTNIAYGPSGVTYFLQLLGNDISATSGSLVFNDTAPHVFNPQSGVITFTGTASALVSAVLYRVT